MSKVTLKARYNEEILRSLTVTDITSESSETSTKYVSERVSIIPETRPQYKLVGYNVDPSNLTNLDPTGNNFTFNMPDVNVIISGKWEGVYSKYLDITSDGLVSGNALLAAEADASVDMIIPKSVNGIKVRGIKNEGFMNSRKLNSVILPEGLTTLGDRAVGYSTYLSAITLPSTLQSIGNYAFSYTSIASIDIPDSVTNIGSGILSGCTELKNVKWPKNYNNIPIDTFRESNDILFEIPNNITVINSGAFADCMFQDIRFPSSVHTIDYYAFGNCIVPSVVIPSTVKTIGNECFSRCRFNSGSGSVKIEAGGITSIPDSAFSDITYLSITIPNTVTNIASNAFKGCREASINIDKPKDSIPGSPWGARDSFVRWKG